MIRLFKRKGDKTVKENWDFFNRDLTSWSFIYGAATQDRRLAAEQPTGDAGEPASPSGGCNSRRGGSAPSLGLSTAPPQQLAIQGYHRRRSSHQRPAHVASQHMPFGGLRTMFTSKATLIHLAPFPGAHSMNMRQAESA